MGKDIKTIGVCSCLLNNGVHAEAQPLLVQVWRLLWVRRLQWGKTGDLKCQWLQLTIGCFALTPRRRPGSWRWQVGTICDGGLETQHAMCL